MPTNILPDFSSEVEKYRINQENLAECLNKIEAMVCVASAVPLQNTQISSQAIYDYFSVLRGLVYDAKNLKQKSLDLLEKIIELEEVCTLSLRETACITQTLEGKTRSQVGEDLKISENSVGFYLKLGEYKLNRLAERLAR